VKKLIVVDTETGGFDPCKNSILTFGAVLYHDGAAVSTFLGKVCEPVLEVDEQALAVNGIRVKDVAGWDSPFLVVQQFEQWLLRNEQYGQQTLVAHGVQFDAPFLRRLWRLAGKNFDAQWSHRMVCTQSVANLLVLAGRLDLPGDSTSLDNVAAAFGFKREHQHHDALEDAILTARVLRRLVDRVTL
jgi:DNA polymerase-3 subunit epsilon